MFNLVQQRKVSVVSMQEICNTENDTSGPRRDTKRDFN